MRSEQIAAQMVKNSLGGVHRCTQVHPVVPRCTTNKCTPRRHLEHTIQTHIKHTCYAVRVAEFGDGKSSQKVKTAR